MTGSIYLYLLYCIIICLFFSYGFLLRILPVFSMLWNLKLYACAQREFSALLRCRDLRQRVGSLFGFHHEFLDTFARGIKCPHLLIKVIAWPVCQRDQVSSPPYQGNILTIIKVPVISWHICQRDQVSSPPYQGNILAIIKVPVISWPVCQRDQVSSPPYQGNFLTSLPEGLNVLHVWTKIETIS